MPYTSGVQIDRVSGGIIVSFPDGKVAFVTHQSLYKMVVDSAAHDAGLKEGEPADDYENTARTLV